MKILFFILFLVSLLQSNEMQRIESIVEDIVKLRGDYKQCLETLKSEKIKETKVEIVKYRDNDTLIKKYKNFLQIKENEILTLKKELHSLKIKSSKGVKILTICQKKEQDNPFPKLMLKEKEQIQTFKASAFRLKTDSLIYNTPSGEKIDAWSKNTSFTSNQKTINWIKITGYFIDKKWKRAKKEMWVKHSKVFKR